MVMHFSYAPIFIVAGLMHPLSALLVYRLLPDRYFPAETHLAAAGSLKAS